MFFYFGSNKRFLKIVLQSKDREKPAFAEGQKLLQLWYLNAALHLKYEDLSR